MSLLTVGTMAFDSIETPFGKAERVVGGAGVYIPLAASYFTDGLKVVSVVGDDFPQHEIDYLESRGIDLEGLQVVEGGKTFSWNGKYRPNMTERITLDTQLNVLETFDPVLPESYKEVDYLMLGNMPPALQLRVIEQLKNRPKLIVLDTMNFWLDTALDELKKVLQHVDVLTINDEEARQLSGKFSLVKAAASIHKMGPKVIVVKKGEHGALLFQNSNVFFAPALPLAEIFDPTGAGDTFAGGFIGYLASTEDLSFENMKRAVIYGSAMASFCVEKFSITRLKEINDDQITERMVNFVQLVNFDAKL
ncbi:MAG: bifunctional hydroxymethylpyrimidine kinase/phosphomethylpyrimidine kinase [Saprospiraceae bacterium]|nr:bifunctional hydroxymethylpyrimidine kinase/phosphomethylpyrimidine kinase [Saprospiraceae bacterium]MCB9325027.1 bifunctional hydroxymethylpyrimidine kinase/phosphomethylpyrimidine kinase [Lewinellaceae bacterium]